MATAETKLITAEEFLVMTPALPHAELVRGEIVEMTPPGFRHGHVCRKVSKIIGNHVDDHDLGWLLCNDSGMITQRNPDTVRGPDISFFSFDRLGRGEAPQGYPSVPPNVVWEVLSPSDLWKNVIAKIAEYLQVGVEVVCVIDPDERTVTNHFVEPPPQILSENDLWSLPKVFPGLEVPVARFLP